MKCELKIMWNQLLVVLLLSLTWIRCTTAQGTPIVLTNAEMEELVDAHNFFRGMVDPPASNMQPVVWNDELASVAQNYAMMCIFDENPNRAAQAPSFDSVGENLSASSTQNPNYTRFVELAWYNQRDNYDYVTNMCTSPGSCTAYTQLVWAETTMIGCGAARCPTITGLSLPDAVLLVCNYAPEANIEDMRPYESGVPCSACPSNSVCINNLCFPETTTTEMPTTATTVSTTTEPTSTESTTTEPTTTDSSELTTTESTTTDPTTTATASTTDVTTTDPTTTAETPSTEATTNETPTTSMSTTATTQETTSAETSTASTEAMVTTPKPTRKPNPCGKKPKLYRKPKPCAMRTRSRLPKEGSRSRPMFSKPSSTSRSRSRSTPHERSRSTSHERSRSRSRSMSHSRSSSRSMRRKTRRPKSKRHSKSRFSRKRTRFGRKFKTRMHYS